jgi:hypothetical protein
MIQNLLVLLCSGTTAIEQLMYYQPKLPNELVIGLLYFQLIFQVDVLLTIDGRLHKLSVICADKPNVAAKNYQAKNNLFFIIKTFKTYATWP